MLRRAAWGWTGASTAGSGPRTPRIWKLVLSPERGEALDLVDDTRRVMNAMERDLGTRLEWVAIDHHNTENPRVHVALRGRSRCALQHD
jgi:hypothetical protein